MGASVFMALLVAACSPDATGPVQDSASAIPGPSSSVVDGFDRPAPQHLIVFEPGSALADFEDAITAGGGTVVLSYPRFGFVSVTGMDAEALEGLAAREDVLYVEEDQLFELGLPEGTDIASAPAASVASPSDPSTAFFFPRQWGLRAIGADVAWASGALGSSGVTVAILDTGIDYLYPDLVGLVDISRSASFQPVDDAYINAFFPGRLPITDIHYHGTHVASTVASNGNTVAGVTSQTTLLAVKVCSVFGSCPSSAVFAGIIHAADNGADVANMSLGGAFLKPGSQGFVSVINRVTNYARQKGMLIVVSAGNSGWDLDHNGPVYSTYCDTPAVACVSATGPTAGTLPAGPFVDVDTPAPYTNYGRSAINVAAPGGNSSAGGAGFVWQACSTTSLYFTVCGSGPIFTLGLTGTSMASPHVAGVAALLVDHMGGGPARIKAALAQTADDLGQRGADPFYGKGRVNAATAVGQ
jgi:subtilisin family serine protease